VRLTGPMLIRAALGGVLVALALAAAVTGPASADTAPIESSPDLPWTNPTHESSLELLLSRIATTIAKRPVTIRCEGETDWRKLITERGGDPSAELGYVGVDFNFFTGQLRSMADFSELAGETVCLPLKRFAVASTKPTKCVVTRIVKKTTYVNRTLPILKTVVVNGRRKEQVVLVRKRVPTVTRKKVTSPPEPCYLGGKRSAREMSNVYWEEYQDYAVAILTLAHEAIHLGGTVGGWQARNGNIAGTPFAEAKAECYGMQWMPYVAEQLGAAPKDGQAIAQFYWENVYPLNQSGPYTEYWSADCRPGGSMDQRPAGKTAWP
jgi:hypothetical protein